MLWDMVISLRKSNIAMEHLERIDDFPNHKTSTYRLIEDFQVPCLIIMITGGYLIELSIYSPIGPSGYGYGNIWEYNGLGGTTPFVIWAVAAKPWLVDEFADCTDQAKGNPSSQLAVCSRETMAHLETSVINAFCLFQGWYPISHITTYYWKWTIEIVDLPNLKMVIFQFANCKRSPEGFFVHGPRHGIWHPQTGTRGRELPV